MTKIPKKKRWIEATGSIGKWTAEVRWDDGTKEELPCAHETFSHFSQRGGTYHDPLEWGVDGPARAVEHPKMIEWVALAKAKGKVMLCHDAPDGSFKRNGYITVYDVSNVSIDTHDGLRFKYDARYHKKML